MNIAKKSKRFFSLDLYILVPSILLSVIGLISLLSTTITADGYFGDLSIVYKQIAFFLVGYVIYIVLSIFDISYTKYWQISLPIYIFTILLLVATLLFAPVINNVKRWLVIAGIPIQASEIAKITVIFITATVLSNKDKYNEWFLFLLTFILTLPIVALIYLQPSGSMALLTLLIWFIVAFTGLNNQLRNTIALSIFGLLVISFLLISITGNWLYIILGVISLLISILAYNYKGNWQKLILVTLVLGILAGGVSTFIYKDILRDYQKARIEAFLNPSETKDSSGFNVDQAKIAIGSGRIFGKGFGNGTQSKRNFLPEHQTDFIFSSFAEEFGLVGCLFMLSLYGFILIRMLNTAVSNSNDSFLAMISIGIAMKVLFEIFINIGTNTGTIPATGIPLPLISAGGGITIMTLFSLGVIQSIINMSKKSKTNEKIIDNY